MIYQLQVRDTLVNSLAANIFDTLKANDDISAILVGIEAYDDSNYTEKTNHCVVDGGPGPGAAGQGGADVHADDHGELPQCILVIVL